MGRQFKGLRSHPLASISIRFRSDQNNSNTIAPLLPSTGLSTMQDSTEFHSISAAYVVVDQTDFFPGDCLPQEKAVDEKSSADLHVRKD